MTTAIKERPILFNAHMVRAILAGRKTVTRRAVKKLAALDCLAADFEPSFLTLPGNADLCPYGKPGDRLWVRESWWQAGDWQATYPEDDTGVWSGSKRVIYSADAAPPNETNHHYPNGLRNGAYSAAEPNKIWRHRPSIHMNRWASRILLEITAVRVERLQDITPEQCRAEGIVQRFPNVNDEFTPDILRGGFAELWMSTGGDWKANPWVWVVEFKQVSP